MASGSQAPSDTPYLGSKISIISKHQIRYEGILYTIDAQAQTLALAKVRSYGTEDRPTEFPIPKQNEVYEYIIFKATDIKDLIVTDQPQPVQQLNKGLPYDPAIHQASGPVQSHGFDPSPRSPTPVNARAVTPDGPKGQGDNMWMQQQSNGPALAPGAGRPQRSRGVGRGFDSNDWSQSARMQQQTAGHVSDMSNQPRAYNQAAATGLPLRSAAMPPGRGGSGYGGHRGGGGAFSRDDGGMRAQDGMGGGGGRGAFGRDVGGPRGSGGGGYGMHRGGGGGYAPLFPSNAGGGNHMMDGGNRPGVGGYRGGGAFYQPSFGPQRGGYGYGYGRGGGMMNGGYGGYRGMGGYQYNNRYQRGGNFRGGRPGFFKAQSGRNGSGDKQQEEDFDFETCNKKFEELESRLAKVKIEKEEGEIDENEEDKESGKGEAGENGEEVEGGEGGEDAKTYYDNSKSFFDSISCEALEKKEANRGYQNRQAERALNQQTFGMTGMRRMGGYRGRGGRGGGYYGRGHR